MILYDHAVQCALYCRRVSGLDDGLHCRRDVRRAEGRRTGPSSYHVTEWHAHWSYCQESTQRTISLSLHAARTRSRITHTHTHTHSSCLALACTCRPVDVSNLQFAPVFRTSFFIVYNCVCLNKLPSYWQEMCWDACRVRCTDTGPHKIDVTYDGLRVPNSPFTAGVVPGCDPSKVKVYGPGQYIPSAVPLTLVAFLIDVWALPDQ